MRGRERISEVNGFTCSAEGIGEVNGFHVQQRGLAK